MNSTNIVPITKARASLGDLAESAKGENYIILTKGGEANVALVDIKYLQTLEREVKKMYTKTFIDPKLLPLTREFSNREIDTWKEEDTLEI